jgi:hypothetical protein
MEPFLAYADNVVTCLSHPEGLLLTIDRPERLVYENPGVHTRHLLISLLSRHVLRRIVDRENAEIV